MNGKKKKLRHRIFSSSPTSGKRLKASSSTRRSSLKSSDSAKNEDNPENNSSDEDADDDEDEEDDESEPMDFERAFGSNNDLPKLEHMDAYQNNTAFDDLHSLEGDSSFDLHSKIDLKLFNQPVLLSSTINLNPLAAVRFVLFVIRSKYSCFIFYFFI